MSGAQRTPATARTGNGAVRVLAVLLFAFLPAAPGGAAERIVPAQAGALQAALAAAADGDVLRLQPGRHAGPVQVRRSVELRGDGQAVIDAGGAGHVVSIEAPDVVLSGLTLTGSGASLASEDSGVFVGKAGDRARIESNRILGNLIGVNLKGPEDAEVRDNLIEGRLDLRSNERGDGVFLWNTPGSVVAGNRFRGGRDGIFVTTSRNNRFIDNHFENLRFAVHYMYTNDSQVSGNVSSGNHLGFALMYSHRLEVFDNVSIGDRDHGLMLNYANQSEIRGNRVAGAAKCVFMYNANFNRLIDNRFERCEIGIHFTAGSERNRIAGNAFIDNRNQVKYVGTRHIEWSDEGRGNYWSDNTAFDIDGDGVSDRPYKPNGLVDQIVWRHPLAKLLLSSPAVQILRWAQAEFPGLYPGGVVDSAPLMRPPLAAPAGAANPIEPVRGDG